MRRKNVKLAWVENENSRAISLKKRWVGLMKKVKELTILCDVKGCIIIFNPNEAEPMVWPSIETARNLLDDYFSLPDIVKKKKETSYESYLKEKTRMVHEQLMKTRNKNKEYFIDQLMVQLHHNREIAGLNLSEIYALLTFSKDNIKLCRKRLDFVQYPPLRNPPVPVPPFEAQFEEFRTTTNDVSVGGDLEDERARKTDEAAKRFSIGTAIRGNQSHYLIDKWIFTSPEPHKPRIYQQSGMDIVTYNENPNPRSYLPYQGSSSNGNPNLEMELVCPPMMTFHGLVGLVSQPLQHHNMIINNPIMAMSQPRQYSFDLMSREFGVKEDGININKGDSQFHRNSNTIAINDGLRQEPPPNGTTFGEGNADATSFDINRAWPGFNNHHS